MFSDNAAELLIKCSQSVDEELAADEAADAKRAKWRRLFAILGTVAAGGGLAYGASKFPGSKLEQGLKDLTRSAKDTIVGKDPETSNAATIAGSTAGGAAAAVAPSAIHALRNRGKLDLKTKSEPAASDLVGNARRWLTKQFGTDTRDNHKATDVLERINKAAPVAGKEGVSPTKGWRGLINNLRSSHAVPDESIQAAAAGSNRNLLTGVIDDMKRDPSFRRKSFQQLISSLDADAALPSSKNNPLLRRLSNALVTDVEGKAPGSRAGARSAAIGKLRNMGDLNASMARRWALPAAKRVGVGALAGGFLANTLSSTGDSKLDQPLK